MKLGRQQWTAVIIIAGLVLLLWIGGGFREGFMSGNPLPTLADLNSISVQQDPTTRKLVLKSTPTPTANTMLNWFNTNVPWPAGTTDGDKASSVVIGAGFLEENIGETNIPNVIQYIQQLPSGLSPTNNINKIINYINTLPNIKRQIDATTLYSATELVNKGQTPNPKTIDDINMAYWWYVYIFGSPITSPTTSPTKTTVTTTPTPATSSSTQPMNVGVPTPCHPSYKSIPGGSLEFKCFS